MKLLLKGARIIDPAQGLDGPGDILLKEGKIAALGEDLPSGVRHLAEILRRGIIDGSIQPFPDATPGKILHMDTLAGWVRGTIPRYEELLPMARPLVRLQGVYRDAIPPEKEDPIL